MNCAVHCAASTARRDSSRIMVPSAHAPLAATALLVGEGTEAAHHQAALLALARLGGALLGLGTVSHGGGGDGHIVVDAAIAIDDHGPRPLGVVLLRAMHRAVVKEDGIA